MEHWFCFLRSPLNDQDLMIQEMVYRSFYQFVYRDIRYMVYDHSFTEDIIQDAFLKAITKGPKMRSDTNIPAWIRQLTRNTALDYLRKLKRNRQTLSEPSVNIGNTTFGEISVASEVEARERDELLYQAIDELKSDGFAPFLYGGEILPGNLQRTEFDSTYPYPAFGKGKEKIASTIFKKMDC